MKVAQDNIKLQSGSHRTVLTENERDVAISYLPQEDFRESTTRVAAPRGRMVQLQSVPGEETLVLPNVWERVQDQDAHRRHEWTEDEHLHPVLQVQQEPREARGLGIHDNRPRRSLA